MAHHFIKSDIIRSVEVSELLNSISVDLDVSSALGLAQASRRAAAFRLFKAREAFGTVKIEVFVSHNAFQTEEVLYPRQLPCWVCDKTLSANKVDLSQREVAQPVFKVQSIQADANGVPGCIHDARALVSEGKLLEAGQLGSFGQSLSVI